MLPRAEAHAAIPRLHGDRSSVRVAVLGSRWVGGTSRSAADGFAEAGFKTFLIPFLEWRPERLYSHHVPGTGVLTRAAVAAMLPIMEARLLHALHRCSPDLVVFFKCDDVHEAIYAAIRKHLGARLAAFHPDDPFAQAGILRRGPSHHRAILQMRTVDAYFLWSNRLVEKALLAGAKNVHYLPFAYDHRLFPAIPPTEEEIREYRDQVTFLGNWDTEREAWLGRLVNFRVGVYGSAYWKTRCRNPQVTSAWRPQSLNREEKSRLIRASAINLNFLRLQNQGACNQRTFEIPGCGGFMLHERSAALPELFRPGIHCDDFGTPEELQEKIRYYLKRPKLRERIAQAGNARAQDFTFRRWAERIVDLTFGDL